MAKKKKYVFKILISGQGGVGKTTLLNRAVTGKFVANTSMTIGVEFHLMSIIIGDDPDEQINVILQGWDFGGQERFRFMLDSYVSGARGAMLLYDLTRLRTLDNLEEWVQIVRKHDKDLPILFVGTKIDRVADITVADDYAKEFMAPLGMFGHLKISSKDGTGVSAAFKKICARILEINGVEVPADKDLGTGKTFTTETPVTPEASPAPNAPATPVTPAPVSQPPFIPPTPAPIQTPAPVSQPPFIPPTPAPIQTPVPASQPPFIPPTPAPAEPVSTPPPESQPLFIPPTPPQPSMGTSEAPESEGETTDEEKKKKDKLFNYFSNNSA